MIGSFTLTYRFLNSAVFILSYSTEPYEWNARLRHDILKLCPFYRCGLFFKFIYKVGIYARCFIGT